MKNLNFLVRTLVIGGFFAGSVAAAAGATSAERREVSDYYGAARGFSISSLNEVEGGLEGGVLLTPDLLLLGHYQGTIFDHIGSCGQSYNVSSVGGAARWFLGNSFFVGGGITRRQIVHYMNGSADYAEGEAPDADGHGNCLRYGTATAVRLDAPLNFGWQWNLSGFTIGFEALNVVIPLTTLDTKDSFTTGNKTYIHDDPREVAARADELGREVIWFMPTLLIGMTL